MDETEAKVDWPALDWSVPPTVRLPVEETTCRSVRPETKFRYPLPKRLVEETEAKVDCPALACKVPPMVRFWVEETLPVGPIEKRRTPVEVATSKRSAVWPPVPWRRRVVVPVVRLLAKRSAVVVAALANPTVCVEVEN